MTHVMQKTINRVSTWANEWCMEITWVGVKNFGATEKQKNIEQGSIKLKELHVCIMRGQKKMARVQKKMAAWRSEVP